MRTLAESILGDIDVSLNIADMYELRYYGGIPIGDANTTRASKVFFADKHPDIPHHKSAYGPCNIYRYLFDWLYEQPADANTEQLRASMKQYWDTPRIDVMRKDANGNDVVFFRWQTNKKNPIKEILISVKLKKK
jgi:hypothetical protein